jgi:hypothetical protein
LCAALMYTLDAAKLLAWECVANDFWALTATLIATSRLMHVFGAWCFQCSGIPQLTYERHQRGKDTSCRAGATTTITPHSRRSPPAARSSQRPVTWSASSRTCSATAAAEGSAPRGKPILVPLDVSRRGHRRSCIEKGNWVANPVDLQGKRLFGRKVALVSAGANGMVGLVLWTITEAMTTIGRPDTNILAQILSGEKFHEQPGRRRRLRF